MRPPASTIWASAESTRSIPARDPMACMRPSRTSMAPPGTMASSRISGPTRGRAGPARVTSCAQFQTASSLISVQRAQARFHRSPEILVLDGVEIYPDVLQRAGLRRRRERLRHRQIGRELGRELKISQPRHHGGGVFENFQRNFGRAMQRLFDKRPALFLGALVSRHHPLKRFGVALDGAGEESPVLLEPA